MSHTHTHTRHFRASGASLALRHVCVCFGWLIFLNAPDVDGPTKHHRLKEKAASEKSSQKATEAGWPRCPQFRRRVSTAKHAAWSSTLLRRLRFNPTSRPIRSPSSPRRLEIKFLRTSGRASTKTACASRGRRKRGSYRGCVETSRVPRTSRADIFRSWAGHRFVFFPRLVPHDTATYNINRVPSVIS